MLIWSEQYATGSALVDTQHKILFDKINELESILLSGKMVRADLDTLIAFIENYTTSHFKYEEQCMFRYKCPAHALNKHEHEQLLLRFGQYKERYLVEGPTPSLVSELHTLCANWIMQHIMKVDILLKLTIK